MSSAERFGLSSDEKAGLEAAAAIASRYRPTDEMPIKRDRLLSLFADLAPLGYLRSVTTGPEGEAPLSPLAFGALVEGLSPDLALIGNHSVQRYIAGYGSDAQKERFLMPLLTGRSIAGIAISEPGVGADLRAMNTEVCKEGAGYRLTGHKHWVTHGMVADLFVVLAHSKEGLTRFLVPGDTVGLRREAMAASGLSHLTFARLTFEDCWLGPQLLFGAAGGGGSGAKEAFPIARLLAALQAIRIGEAALDAALNFAAERCLFGRRLLDGELVREAAAGHLTDLEAARLLCYRGLAKGAGIETAGLASGAKAMATDNATAAIAWCGQLLGAASLEAGHSLHRLSRDAEMMAVVDGTSVLNRFVLGRKLSRNRTTGQG